MKISHGVPQSFLPYQIITKEKKCLGYPTVNTFGIPKHTQSMIAYMILTGNSGLKLHRWNVVNMHYWLTNRRQLLTKHVDGKFLLTT